MSRGEQGGDFNELSGPVRGGRTQYIPTRSHHLTNWVTHSRVIDTGHFAIGKVTSIEEAPGKREGIIYTHCWTPHGVGQSDSHLHLNAKWHRGSACFLAVYTEGSHGGLAGDFVH